MRLYKNASSRVKELVARRILGHLNFSNAVFLRFPVECQSQLLYLAHLLLPSPAWFACPRAGSAWAPTPGRITSARFIAYGLMPFCWPRAKLRTRSMHASCMRPGPRHRLAGVLPTLSLAVR